MTEDEFKAMRPRPGDIVHLKVLRIESVNGHEVVLFTEARSFFTVDIAAINYVQRVNRLAMVGDTVQNIDGIKYGTVHAVVGGNVAVEWEDGGVGWVHTSRLRVIHDPA